MARTSSTCLRCQPSPQPPDAAAYAYLLGMYLGDGCVSRLARCYSLRISCSEPYPGVMAECTAAIRAVRPGARVWATKAPGCRHVTSLWMHWPCLFPQHGPGRKHERAIVLADWQRDLVTAEPGRFLRGLFHSDGCRITNWTVRTVAGRPKRYEYPRYFFTNASEDILGLCCWALDLLAIAHRHPKPRNISVARREAVAALDVHVGPKY